MKTSSTIDRRGLLAALGVLGAGRAIAQQGGPGGSRAPIPYPAPTAEEIESLTFMREEEKLARDVYQYLYERWGSTVFDRIADSEEQHFASVGRLLVRYGIADPAAGNAPGVFVSGKLSTLYAELTAKGAMSLRDALNVGVTIEKVDIADLEVALPKATKFDIKRVYSNLMEASFQHLDTFESTLQILDALS